MILVEVRVAWYSAMAHDHLTYDHQRLGKPGPAMFDPDHKASCDLDAQARATRRAHRPARSSSSTTTAGAASRS